MTIKAFILYVQLNPNLNEDQIKSIRKESELNDYFPLPPECCNCKYGKIQGWLELDHVINGCRKGVIESDVVQYKVDESMFVCKNWTINPECESE